MISLLSFLAGVLLILIPAVALRTLMNAAADGSRPRSSILTFALIAGLAFALALIFAAESVAVAVLGAVIALGGWMLLRRRIASGAPRADIVVDRPLLGDALSPQLAADLAALEHQMRAQAAREDTPPAELNDR